MKKILAIMLVLALPILAQAQIKFPEYLEHNDPDKALIHTDQLRGGYQEVADISERNSLPEDKRALGMVMTWVNGTEYVTARYEGTSTLDAEWIDNSNWLDIVAGVEFPSRISVDTISSEAQSVNLIFTDTGVDTGLKLIGGQFSVGEKNNGKESVFGEGDSYTEGMVVLTTTDGVTFLDKTTEAIEVDGSTFAPFGGGVPNVDAAFYIGSDDSLIGTKLYHSLLVDAGIGSVVREYWNGTIWTTFTIMATNANSPYEQRADNIGTVLGAEQVRFGFTENQTLIEINSNLKYWIRFRVTSALTSDGLVDQIKLHSNRFEINEDGFTEYFGAGIYKKELIAHLTTTADLDGFNPQNQTIDYTTDWALDQVDNRLTNGAIDGFGGIFTIPEGLDTSKPVIFEINYAGYSGTTGDVEFLLQDAQMQLGDKVDGTHPVNASTTKTISVLGTEIETIKQAMFEIPVEELTPGEFVSYSFSRDATAGSATDNYTGNVGVISLRIIGYFWKP